ncbi:MAG: hypothetical protein Q4D94_00320 [Bacillota bacterium]|nr:hypothetical protein [Bacillota bacterium]
MNRFATKNDQSPLHFLPRIRLIYFLCPLLLILFILGLSSISETTVSRQQESLENALNRDIIHCYAVEGFYPPSLEYIEEHYGLVYDKDLFFVDYQPIGSNLRPDVTILLKQ